MGAAGEEGTEDVGDRADVGSFGADDVERKVRIVVGDECGFECDGGRSAGDFDAFAGEFVEGLPLDFFGGEHGRDLLDGALKILEGFFDFSKSWDVIGSGCCLSVAVIGIGGDAECESCLVFFFGAEE